MATNKQIDAVAKVLWDRYYGYYDTEEYGANTPTSGRGVFEAAREVIDALEKLGSVQQPLTIVDMLAVAWTTFDEWRTKSKHETVLRALEKHYCIKADYQDPRMHPVAAAMARLNAAVLRQELSTGQGTKNEHDERSNDGIPVKLL